MRLLLVAALAALGIGYATGGRLANFENIRIRWWALAILGLALQIPLPFGWSDNHTLESCLLVVSFALLILFCWRNLAIRGVAIVAIGLLLNLTVIAANAGMPVSRQAVISSGQRDVLAELEHGNAAKHHLERQGDVLLPLADVIPIPPPIAQVVSIGDLIVYAGIIIVVVWSMRKRTRGSAQVQPQGESPGQDPRGGEA
jgi:Family of unknown function (DUF5317)